MIITIFINVFCLQKGSVLVTNCTFTCSIKDNWIQEEIPVSSKQDTEEVEEYDVDQYDENTVPTTYDEGLANELSDDEAHNIIVSTMTWF